MAVPFQHVTILGVGLIGGSLGLALRRYAPELVITGVDERPALDVALRRDAIHRKAANVADGVREADLIVLAAPISANMSLLRAALRDAPEDAILTDVGSVKSPIVDYAEEHLAGNRLFVGGHPMTGSERSGVGHADALLFENATYVVCPPHDLEDPRYLALVALLSRIGARVMAVDAARHDRIAAAISHLPQLLSIALVNHIEAGGSDDAMLQLAAGGFRDMTRIASSSFGMWRDILAANAGPVMDAMAIFAAEFQRLRNRLAEEDSTALEQLFERAATIRESVPSHSKGFLQPLADVYVYTRDEPGALQRITGSLADSEINIKDMELLKIREGTGGTFRVGIATDREADDAVACLIDAGFQAYRL